MSTLSYTDVPLILDENKTELKFITNFLGTTTVECKSGYGLDVQTEIKMLRVLEKAKKSLPIEISSTFCGAHSVPKYVHRANI